MTERVGPLSELLIDKLSAKMEAELDRFKFRLSTLSPCEIMNHAYELTVKKDIIYALDSINCDLSPERCKALLKSKSPLEDVYKDFIKKDISLIDDLSETIEERADIEIKKEMDVPSI